MNTLPLNRFPEMPLLSPMQYSFLYVEKLGRKYARTSEKPIKYTCQTPLFSSITFGGYKPSHGLSFSVEGGWYLYGVDVLKW